MDNIIRNPFLEASVASLTRYWASVGGYQRLLSVLPVILLVVSGWVAAQVTWQMTAVFSPRENVVPELFKPPALQEQLLPASFWKWSRWTDLYAKPPPVVQKNIALKVEVSGILGYGESGSAMLKVGKKTAAALYFVGDDLGGGILLSGVAIDSVTLTQGALTKTVLLKTKASDSLFQVAPAPKPSAPPAPKEKEDIVVSAEKLKPEVRTKLDTLGKQVQQDPTSLTKDFSADAVNRGGSIIGYRLRYNVDPALLLALGLRPTDILLEVNGIPTAEISGNPSIFASLIGLDQYNVLIERSGRQQRLVLRP